VKISKRQLRQIIKEERAKLAEQYSQDFTPQEQKVMDMIDQLEDAIYDMGKSNPEMTDYYVNLFRALESAGVNVGSIAALT
tara:strand:+ start:783 stop:1025 length:243 start_codon:yes stop_codon:yes gene_type:complete